MQTPYRKEPDPGIEPTTFILWGTSANHCTTASSWTDSFLLFYNILFFNTFSWNGVHVQQCEGGLRAPGFPCFSQLHCVKWFSTFCSTKKSEKGTLITTWRRSSSCTRLSPSATFDLTHFLCLHWAVRSARLNSAVSLENVTRWQFPNEFFFYGQRRKCCFKSV